MEIKNVLFTVFGLPVANTGLAVGSIAVLFVIGFFLFCKADKLNKTNRKICYDKIRNHPLVPEDAEIIEFSSKDGLGVDRLWEIINEFVTAVSEG